MIDTSAKIADRFLKTFERTDTVQTDMDHSSIQAYEFGPFRLEAAERVLLRGHDIVPLAVKAFEVLHYLVQNRGRVIAKDALIRHVWPDCFVEENNLTQNISALRRVLADDPDQPRFIETIPRRGYRFVAEVHESSPPGPQVAVAEAAPSRRPQVKSLAVLPFRAIGADAGPDFLGLGIADALVTRLGNLEQIDVRPTASVLRYDGQALDWATAGRELRVDAVLSGCIQRSGALVRVTVQLIAVADGTTLWAGQFDDPFTDIFSVEDSISQQVARTLTLKLTGDESKRLSQRPTANPEAHQAYLRGRYFWNRRAEEDLRKSIRCFQEAVHLDPNYALAYVGLAEAYSVLGGYSALAPKEAYSRSRAAALSALEIDGTLAEAHTSLGDELMYYQWDVAGAEREYRRAIELRPDYATAHHFYAWHLISQRRFSEASDEMRRAEDLDPLSPMINTALSHPPYYAGKFDEAIAILEKALDMNPGFDLAHVHMARSCLYNGMPERAIAEFRRAAELSPGRPLVLAALSHGLAFVGQRQEAEKLLGELVALSATRYVSPYYIATTWAGLGEVEKALCSLEAAFEERYSQLVMLALEPAWNSFRRNRRWNDLVERVGFAAARTGAASAH